MDTLFGNTAVAFSRLSNNELKRANYLFSFMSSQALCSIGIKLVQLSVTAHLPINWLLRNTIFRQFCGGETVKEAAAIAESMGQYGVYTILDYGVEGKEDEAIYDATVEEFVKAIDAAATHREIPFISLKVTGFSRFALLQKISENGQLSAAEKMEWSRVFDRIDKICNAAAKHKIMVLVDAEETWILEACNQLAEAMMERYNKERAFVFNTFQLYCSGTLPFLKDAITAARQKGYILGAKLVRGAYMEKERKRAQECGYPDPIQTSKAATDNDFNTAVELCLRNLGAVSLFIGTHNEESNLKAIELMRSLGISNNDKRVYFSQLLGMSDHISYNLAKEGYNVSKYVPYGPVKDVVPYLLRRASENTSVAGQTGRELTLIRKELVRRSSEM